jgi:hypothetical protein
VRHPPRLLNRSATDEAVSVTLQAVMSSTENPWLALCHGGNRGSNPLGHAVKINCLDLWRTSLRVGCT